MSGGFDATAELAPALNPSADGYLRCEIARLLHQPMQHLLSCLDVETGRPQVSGSGALVATLTGCTEWVGTGWDSAAPGPAISIGWDWHAATLAGARRYVRSGVPRSNVMLIDARGHDLGFEATAVQMGMWIDRWQWEAAVAEYLSNIYA